MRNAFSEALYELATKDDRICIVVADISPAGAMSSFSEEFPERFINVGVAEQSMIGICAGLALKGYRPFAYTIATFSLYRPFEMIRDDLCYQKLPVTVVGMGSGLVYSTLGSTHHTQEDVSICNALPNMKIIAPADPLETVLATSWCATMNNGGPVYLKLGKAGEPNLTDCAIEDWQFGKLRRLRSGTDICLVSYGPILKKAFEAADVLGEAGISSAVVACSTLKPFDSEGFAELFRSFKKIILIEENAPFGGMCARVKQLAWDCSATCEIVAFTLQDDFIHMYGTHDDLLEAHGISTDRIVSTVLS